MKTLIVAFLIILYFITSLPFYPLLITAPGFAKKNIVSPILSFYSRIILKVLGIKVKGDISFDIKPGSIIVANHLGYLDLFLISAVYKGCFISTKEVQADPIFGTLATLGGCIFIERRNKENLKNEMKVVQEHLEQGVNVFFFPEAKSTNGEEVLRFKRPFFTPAMNLNKDILAVTINFKSVDGQKVTPFNRDQVFWYRQNSLLEHIKGLMAIKSIDIEIQAEYLKHGDYSTQANHPAELAQRIVSANYVPVI